MRKLLTAGVVGSLLLIGPSLAVAQTTGSVDNQQLIALLTQLVQTLEQQLAMLEANLSASSQSTQTTQTSGTNALNSKGTTNTQSTAPQAGGISAPCESVPGTSVTGSTNTKNTDITWTDLGTAGAGYSVVGVGSLRGAGSHDILFENGSGEVGYLTSQAVWYDLGNAGSYRVVGVSDMNGDGTSDIIFENGTSGGDIGYWIVNPNAVSNNVPQATPNVTWADLGTAGAGYSVVGVGSLRGAGSHDILFENGSGEVGYLTSQAVWYDLGNAGSYRVVGVSDMNGDGTSDIIFENGTSGGDIGYWVVNPNAVGNSAPQSSPNMTWVDLGAPGAGGYSVVGVGNFGGSGSHDILFQSTSGDVGYWTVVGNQISWIDLGNAGAYRVAGITDMNGDGTSDIIFENGTSGGDIGYWIVNPNAASNGASSAPVLGGTSNTATPISCGTSNTTAPVSGGTSNTPTPESGGPSNIPTPVSGGASDTPAPVSGGTSKVSGGTSNTTPPETEGSSSEGPNSVNNGPSIY